MTTHIVSDRINLGAMSPLHCVFKTLSNLPMAGVVLTGPWLLFLYPLIGA